MNRVLKFELTLSEHNCPGIMGMTEAEIKECGIELIILEKTSSLPPVSGQWSANIFGTSGGMCVMTVTFQYKEAQ
jgi:hypothetical protein